LFSLGRTACDICPVRDNPQPSIKLSKAVYELVSTRPSEANREDKMAKHILVVDDVEDILQLFNEILHNEEGYDVTLTIPKPGIIEWIKEHKPDLVILDLMFWGEDLGWQLIQELEMDRATAKIPIIICTSAAERKLREREGWLAERNVQVIYKPFNINELLLAVQQKLGEAG
jgi:two-component system response regulator BaeR